MLDKKFTPQTSFQRANFLFRRGEWEASLQAYLEIWRSQPELRQLVKNNVTQLLSRAESGSIGLDFIDQSECLMGGVIPAGLVSDSRLVVAEQRPSGFALDAPWPAGGSPSFFLGSPGRSSMSSPLFNVLFGDFGVERIYVVNLSRRPDRYIRILREMRYQGLPVDRVDAVDARTSRAAIAAYENFRSRAVEDKLPSSRHISDAIMARYKSELSIGVFGYLLSQARVFRDALKRGYQRILVLDDDVFFCTDAADRLQRIHRVLPGDMKLLALGTSEYADRNSDRFSRAKLSEHGDLYRPLPGETCGSFAVIYDRSCFQELLSTIEGLDGTYDNVVLGSLYSRYPDQCLAVSPAICIPDVGDSDIRPNARTQATHSRKMQWEFARYAEYTAPFNVSIVVESFAPIRNIDSMRQELASAIFINIYYLSEDGLRPIIPGHVFVSSGKSVSSLGIADSEDLRNAVEAIGIPHSDMVLVWPNHLLLSDDTVLDAVAKAMAISNRRARSAGMIDGAPFCLDAGVRPVPRRHSIIIPCYREVAYVLPTVKSALLQDARDFEVIVVNDNPSNFGFATDLASRVSTWSQEINKPSLMARLKILTHNINRNASAARNTGLMISTGEYISFLDDDDHYECNRLSAIEFPLSGATESIGACYCGYTGAWNGERSASRFPKGDLGVQVLALRYGEHYMCTNTVSFLRRSLQRLGGFNETYRRHQDIELMTRFFGQFQITAVEEFLVRNRPSPVPETFTADISALCRLKALFLSDMRSEIWGRGPEVVEEVLNSHTRDITKRDKSISDETAQLIRSFLGASLRQY